MVHLNYANLISAFRLICAPACFWLILSGNVRLASIIFILAVLTDKLDGCVARSTKQESELGKTLDGVADAALIDLAYIAFFAKGMVPRLFFVVIAAGMTIIGIAVYRCSRRKRMLSHPGWAQGKAAVVLAYFLAVYLMLGFHNTVLVWGSGALYLLLISYYLIGLA